MHISMICVELGSIYPILMSVSRLKKTFTYTLTSLIFTSSHFRFTLYF